MPTFRALSSDNNLQEIIKSAFDTDLPINGAWGYSQELATIISSLDIPYIQLEHMFASMRAYIEMNMTQDEAHRYSSINLTEISRQEIPSGNEIYHKVCYEITAMKESVYNDFIKEYKENYGKKSFDLSGHFRRREEATLQREVWHWFKIK